LSKKKPQATISPLSAYDIYRIPKEFPNVRLYKWFETLDCKKYEVGDTYNGGKITKIFFEESISRSVDNTISIELDYSTVVRLNKENCISSLKRII